ncbi:MAG TPA: hypothetical protein VHC70_12685, partial [Phycisphaerales bacterium]|nr:hypothetical protein [Phycisphaerales bacterium]
LIEVDSARRAPAKETRGRGKTAKETKESPKEKKGKEEGKRLEGKKTEAGTRSDVSPTAAGSTAKPAPAETKKPKLKMRLDLKTGKMVPVDEGPRLF